MQTSLHVQKVLCVHSCLQRCTTQGACVQVGLLCVLQTNNPCTHKHMRRGKGVAAESGVIYRCASSERGRRRRRDGGSMGENEDGEERQGQRRAVS